MEAADGDVDRMDGPASHHLHDPVAEPLQPEARFDQLRVIDRHRKPALVAEKVGGVEEMNMEGMALDPLATVEKTPQLRDTGGGHDLERRLERPAGGHLVGDRADPTDPRHQIRHLVDGPTDEDLLEEPGGLVDVELGDPDAVLVDADAQRSLPLDPGQRLDDEGPRSTHDAPSPAASRSPSTRNAGAQALIPRTSRSSSSRGTPAAS